MKKYIHYCWFGDKPLPKLAKKCIESWKKYLPDYELKEWNESNSNVEECPFIKEAYENKKWAFVADYVRTKAMYEYGGIYFDTDMEIIKPIDELLDSIVELIEVENQESYKAALEKTKKTRVTQEKIDLVKDLLPSILRPGGVNPLGVLHSELSEGLHAETDDRCLENASHIRDILTFLINQIIQSKNAAKQFTTSMKSLLEKKSKN